MTKFSFRVTLLLWLVLFLTTWNALRLSTALAWQNTLSEFAAKPAPIVSVVSGGVWMVVGVILIWSIWQKKAWAATMLLGAVTAYTVWYWSERFIWHNPHSNWPFAIVVNLALIIFILFTIKPLTREAYERTIENPKVD